jgi:hypothetical protein
MSKDDGQSQDKPSRAVIEFAGQDSATITAFRFVNMTLGQVLVLAEWAALQAEIVKAKLAEQQRPNSGPHIVVPNLRLQ